MYLTYAEYTAMGGTLEESAYNRYEYRAESIINWYTFNRLANETEYPEAVKKCMFMLIDILIRQDKILDGGDSGEGFVGIVAIDAAQCIDEIEEHHQAEADACRAV